MAGEYLTPTPYANPLTGLSNDMIQGLLGYMKDKQRTQQMQGLAGLLESTGIPQTVERAAYAESPKALLDALTNVNRANVPLLKPETADAIMNIAPLVGPAARAAESGAMAAGRAGERYAEKVVPQIMERGGLPAQLLGDLSQGSVRKMSNEVSNMPLRTFKTSDGYTLYELKNGKIVDNLDPEGVDMSWDNFKQLKDDFGDDVYQVEDELGKRKSAISSTVSPNLLDDWYAFRAEPTKDELYQQALNKQNATKSNVVEFPKTNLLETAEPKASVSQIGSAESNARNAIENLMNQARYFGVDSPIDYTKMPVGAVMQDLDSYLGMSKQVADLPDSAKTSLRNLWYKAEDAANAYKRVYGENKLMGKPEEAANDARKPFVWDEKKLKKNLKSGILTQEEYNNAIEWNKKAKGLLD